MVIWNWHTGMAIRYNIVDGIGKVHDSRRPTKAHDVTTHKNTTWRTKIPVLSSAEGTPLSDDCYGIERKIYDAETGEDLSHLYLVAYDEEGIVDYQLRDENNHYVHRATGEEIVIITERRKLRFDPPLPDLWKED